MDVWYSSSKRRVHSCVFSFLLMLFHAYSLRLTRFTLHVMSVYSVFLLGGMMMTLLFPLFYGPLFLH